MENPYANLSVKNLNFENTLTKSVVLATLYFPLAVFGLALLQHTDFIAPLWPASALLLVFLLHSLPRQWPLMLALCYLAGLSADLLLGGELSLSMILGAADSLDAVVAAVLIKLYLRRPLDLLQLGDSLAFLAFGGLLAPMLGATVAGMAVHIFHETPFLQMWYQWWASTAVGVFVFGPLFLFWKESNPRRIFYGSRVTETGILVLSGVIVSVVAFNTAQLPLFFLVVPWLLWSGLRIGIGVTVWFGLMLSLTAVWATVQQLPGMHWFGLELRTQIQSVQLYLTIAIVPALIVAITLAGIRRSENQNRKLASALQQTADAVMVTDTAGEIEYVNTSFLQMTGFDSSEVVGATPRILRSGRQDPEFYRQLWHDLGEGKVWNDVLINRRKDGSVYFEEKTISPIRGENGAITHFVSTGKDITERKKIQERLRFLAYHDPLTGLPNRALLMERLQHAVAKSRRAGSSVAVLFIDLDGFKLINDALGHEVGDKVLCDVARRLQDVLREEDTIARLGGDEFTVLIEEVEHLDEVSEVVRKLHAALQQPLEGNGRALSVTCSVGISLFPDDADNPVELVQRADTAMYRAKDSGRNRSQFYSAEMGEQVERQLSLLTELQHAQKEGEFVLHYQPQLNLTTQKVEVVEALLRWKHPQRGLEPPAVFLPALEDSGLIREVGAWVLNQACSDAASWNRQRSDPLRVSVNLSGVQLEEESLLDQIQMALDNSGLQASWLECEITETAMMFNTELSSSILNRLGELGVTIAIDDFGTGYSSLAYLKKFPVQVLKIDRAFVSDLLEDDDDRAIVSAILALASSLSLDVVAEGVETEYQLQALTEQGCGALQGYLLGRPVEVDELQALVDNIESSHFISGFDRRKR